MPRIVTKTIENATIDAMAADAKFNFLACLESFRRQKVMSAPAAGCSRCAQRKAMRAQASVYASAKQCIAGAGAAEKEQLKRVLGANRVVVILPHGRRVAPFEF